MTAVFALVLAVLLALDCAQTRVIFLNPLRWRERNPLIRWVAGHALTPQGRARLVVLYFVAVAVITGALLALTWESLLSASIIGFFTAAEIVCVVNNHRLGIRI